MARTTSWSLGSKSREPSEVGEGSGDVAELLANEATFTKCDDRLVIYVEGMRKVSNRLTVAAHLR